MKRFFLSLGKIFLFSLITATALLVLANTQALMLESAKQSSFVKGYSSCKAKYTRT